MSREGNKAEDKATLKFGNRVDLDTPAASQIYDVWIRDAIKET